MSPVTTIGRVHSPVTTPLATTASATKTAELLPPASSYAGSAQGGLTQLYLLMTQLRDQEMRLSQSQIDGAKADRDVQLQKKIDAERKAQEAKEKGGFLDDIAGNIGIAGVVGLVTFNYAVVAADYAAHKSGVVQNLKVDVVDVGAYVAKGPEGLVVDALLRKLDVAPEQARDLLAKLGIPKDAPGISDDDVKPIARKVLAANFIIASATASVLSCGTAGGLVVALTGLALSYGGQYMAEHKTLDGVFGEGASQWVGIGMEIYGALAAGMSGLAGGATLVNAGVAKAASVVNGTLDVVQGSDQVVRSIHEREADKAAIDAESAKQQIKRLERMIDFVLDRLKESNDVHKKTGEAIQNTIQTLDDTKLSMTQGIRG